MNHNNSPDLMRLLKRLKLSGILPCHPDGATYALDERLHPLAFLECCLHDEVERRNARILQQRVERAHLSELATLERFDWSARSTIDRQRVTELFGLGFLHRHEDGILQGPTGVGTTFLTRGIGQRPSLSSAHFATHLSE